MLKYQSLQQVITDILTFDTTSIKILLRQFPLLALKNDIEIANCNQLFDQFIINSNFQNFQWQITVDHIESHESWKKKRDSIKKDKIKKSFGPVLVLEYGPQ